MQMNTKKIVLAIALASMLLIAGCSDQDVNNTGEELANETGNDISKIQPGESYQFEVKMTEKNQLGLVRAQPPFIMESSLERANLIRRYQYLNDRNNVHHVYMMSNDGKVIAYFVAQGKVSSVNSKLTNDKQIIATKECLNEHGSGGGDDETNCYKTVESPQMDGSYGSNGNAIFFFTTSGDYVEWNGRYVVSEEPLEINTAISLQQQVDGSGNDASRNANETNTTS